MSAVVVEAPRTRIPLRLFAFFAAVLLAAAVFATSAWSFIAPDISHEVRIGPGSSFKPGSVTSFVYDGERLTAFNRPAPPAAWGWPVAYPLPDGELVHVVRLPDGDLRVLSGVSPHRGQQVVWFPDGEIEVGNVRGVFGDDFSWWLVDGTQVFGPAPRDLPTYPYRIDDSGALVIDLSEPIEGEWLPDIWRSGAAREVPPSYDFLDPGWPTSGWPSTVGR